MHSEEVDIRETRPSSKPPSMQPSRNPSRQNTFNASQLAEAVDDLPGSKAPSRHNSMSHNDLAQAMEALIMQSADTSVPQPPLGFSPQQISAHAGAMDEEEVVPLVNVASEHRRKRQQTKTPKNPSMFVSSPGAFSSEVRDASKDQGKFDRATLYQAQLQSDQHCLIVDLSSLRVLFANSRCSSLFETLNPLTQREVHELIQKDDRTNVSACLMYLNIGEFGILEPQEVRILTAMGTQWASLSGKQLVGSWWWLTFSPLSEGGFVSSPCPPGMLQEVPRDLL